MQYAVAVLRILHEVYSSRYSCVRHFISGSKRGLCAILHNVNGTNKNDVQAVIEKMSSPSDDIHDLPTDLSCLPPQVDDVLSSEKSQLETASAFVSNLDLCRSEGQRSRVKVFKSDARSNNGDGITQFPDVSVVYSSRYKGTGASKLRSYEKQWMDRYTALKEYKEKFGDCVVSQKGPYPVLGRWVNKQRDFNKLFRAGKRTTLNEHRIKLLDGIGFVWDASAIKTFFFKRDNGKWMKYYEQLKIYKEKHGTCMVKRKFKADDLPLGEWVHKQRQQYTLKKRGKYSTISDERIEKLNELNFTWPDIIMPHAKGSSINEEKLQGNDNIELGHESLLHPEIAIDTEIAAVASTKSDGDETEANVTSVHDHRNHSFNVDVEHYLRSIMPVAGEECDSQVVGAVPKDSIPCEFSDV